VVCRLRPALPQNFYYEHPAVTARSEEETRRYRETRDIHVTGEGVPKPVQTFDEASFPGGCWRLRGGWVDGGCWLPGCRRAGVG
jgi:hypothetical protein